MLSPIQNFPLKFLYFDIIKKSKEALFFSLWFCFIWSSSDPIGGEDGVVHVLYTGCKCWAERGQDSVGG